MGVGHGELGVNALASPSTLGARLSYSHHVKRNLALSAYGQLQYERLAEQYGYEVGAGLLWRF